MLYKDSLFKLLQTKAIGVYNSKDVNFRTRDLLYCKGLLNNNDSLHLFFCHWPSRYGGQLQSEPRRILAANILRHQVDSIFRSDSTAQVIIMGDFNDEFHNTSLIKHLRARASKDIRLKDDLVNLASFQNQSLGSHKYQGTWSYLDQVIVSQRLLNSVSCIIHNKGQFTFRAPFLLENDERHIGEKPFRTYLGYRYNGGFSDHLPIYLKLIINNSVE